MHILILTSIVVHETGKSISSGSHTMIGVYIGGTPFILHGRSAHVAGIKAEDDRCIRIQ